MSSFCKCKSYSHFFSKNLHVCAIFDDQRFKDMLTNKIVSFEQLGPEIHYLSGVLIGFSLLRVYYRLFIFGLRQVHYFEIFDRNLK